MTARLKLPSAIPARGDFATGLTSSSSSYATRGSFNPLTTSSLSSSSTSGSAMLPFDFGFRAPVAGGAGTDTTLTYGYGAANGAIPHAVTSRSNGDAFSYDANGNMTARTMGGVTWTQTFDAENHLVSVSNGPTTTTYVYDADGNRVKCIVGSGPTAVTILYIANMEIELHGSTEDHRTVYYSAGGAFRVIGGADAGLYFRLSDHLGSTSLVTKSDGTEQPNSRVVYAPFGEVRSGQQSTLTDFGYTGQRHDDTDGLMYYGARYYLPGIQHFISADTIPTAAGNMQTVNRFAYTRNNPVKRVDPTGHRDCDDLPGDCGTIRDTSGPAPDCVVKGGDACRQNFRFADEKSNLQDTKYVIGLWLNILNEKGGARGQQMVRTYNNASSCQGKYCPPPLQIIIGNTGAIARTDVRANVITLSPGLVNRVDDGGDSLLITAGYFGHELFHLAQPWLAGTLRGEVNAYSAQYDVYKAMGLGDKLTWTTTTRDTFLPFYNHETMRVSPDNVLANDQILQSSGCCNGMRPSPFYPLVYSEHE